MAEYPQKTANSLNWESRIYYASPLRGSFMADASRITVGELKKRMEAGEDFTIVDVRNPRAWAETDTALPGAIRIPLEEFEQNVSRIPKNRPVVAYCT